jgi:hypothetical protein
MRKARNGPSVVRRENVEARIAFFEHHREHLFGATRKRAERLDFLAQIAGHLVRQPLANTLVKTSTQHLRELVVVLDKKIAEAIERFHMGVLQPTALRDKLRSLYATANRARKKHHITINRNTAPQSQRLGAAAFRKADMRTIVGIGGLDVVTFGMPHQEKDTLVRKDSLEEILGLNKICKFIEHQVEFRFFPAFKASIKVKCYNFSQEHRLRILRGFPTTNH